MAPTIVVWDSLAIAEYLAERHPGLWPRDDKARAWARSATAEMHSGFADLRNEFGMNLRVSKKLAPSPPVAKEIARIEALWSEGRERFGGTGDFLCGEFGVVDAFFCPVAFRFAIYQHRTRRNRRGVSAHTARVARDARLGRRRCA